MEALNPQRVVVEVLDTHGRVHARERFESGDAGCRVTLGRSVVADVILDDPHVAALHARIDIDSGGRVCITDLGSRNGIVIDGQRHRALTQHALGGREFRLGRVRIRVRTSDEDLRPERSDHEVDLSLVRSSPWVAWMTAFLWIGIVAYVTWLDAPRDIPTVLAGSLAFALAVAAGWIGIWVLLSRMLQGEWRWMTHAAIFFGVSAGVFIIDALLGVGWFAFGLPQGQWRETLLVTAGLVLVLYLHLSNVSALRRRTAVLFASLFPILIVGTMTWVQARNQARDVNHIGVPEKVYPPILKVRSGVSIDEYFTEAVRLRAAADEKRKALPSSDSDAAEDGTE